MLAYGLRKYKMDTKNLLYDVFRYKNHRKQIKQFIYSYDNISELSAI